MQCICLQALISDAVASTTAASHMVGTAWYRLSIDRNPSNKAAVATQQCGQQSAPHQIAVHSPMVECLINFHSQQPKGCAVDASLCSSQGLQRIVRLAAVGRSCTGATSALCEQAVDVSKLQAAALKRQTCCQGSPAQPAAADSHRCWHP